MGRPWTTSPAVKYETPVLLREEEGDGGGGGGGGGVGLGGSDGSRQLVSSSSC